MGATVDNTRSTQAGFTATREEDGIRISLDDAKLEKSGGELRTIGNDGELIETTPNVIRSAGREIEVDFTVVNDHEAIATIQNVEGMSPYLVLKKGKAACFRDNVITGIAGGCVAGGIPTVGVGCPEGAIGGAIMGLASSIANCEQHTKVLRQDGKE